MAKYAVLEGDSRITSRFDECGIANGGYEFTPVTGDRAAAKVLADGILTLMRLGDNDLGDYVEVTHPNGTVSVYAKLSGIELSFYGKASVTNPYVIAKTPVKAGTVIGYIKGEGACLRLCVRDADGTYVNPHGFLYGKKALVDKEVAMYTS